MASNYYQHNLGTSSSYSLELTGPVNITNLTYVYPPIISTNSNFTSGTNINTSFTFTIANQNYGNGTYIYSCQNQYVSQTYLNLLVNGIFGSTANQGWEPSNDGNPGKYSTTSPYALVNNSSGATTATNSITYYGLWLQVQLPQSIYINGVYIAPIYGAPSAMPGIIQVVGSTNGSTWEYIGQISGIIPVIGENKLYPLNILSFSAYNYFRFIFTNVYGNYGGIRLTQFYVTGATTSSALQMNPIQKIINGSGSIVTSNILPQSFVGIGTASPSQILDVNGNAYVRGIIYAGAPNYTIAAGEEGGKILFGGTYADTLSNTNDPTGGCIVSRIYALSEQSEIVIYKGNDPNASGPDRIRLRAGNLVFDTYNDNQGYGTTRPYPYETVGSTYTLMDSVGNWTMRGNLRAQKLSLNGNTANSFNVFEIRVSASADQGTNSTNEATANFYASGFNSGIGYFFLNGYGSTTYVGTAYINCSGMSINAMWSGAYNYNCDKRGKKYIDITDTSIILNKLISIPIQKYIYMINNKTYNGLYAQDLLEIFPEAVNVNKGPLNIINAYATKMELVNNQIIITFNIENDITILSNQLIKMQINKRLIELPIISYNYSNGVGIIIVNEWINYDSNDIVYLYGPIYDDLLSIDLASLSQILI
jgi:hypothetical protein